MWRLVLAIVLLLVSAPLTAYYTSCLQINRLERPLAFLMYEKALLCGSFFPLLGGIIMLFIAAGWKWGLGGLAAYWVLVVFVLMPIAARIRRGRFP